jgi:hypothetical protein
MRTITAQELTTDDIIVENGHDWPVLFSCGASVAGYTTVHLVDGTRTGYRNDAAVTVR